jgi:hypothetical protein
MDDAAAGTRLCSKSERSADQPERSEGEDIFIHRGVTSRATLFRCRSAVSNPSVKRALCLPYLLLFPFTPVGLAILLSIGTLVMALLHRRDDIVTTGITTTVVMVVAAMSPTDAWQRPLLRLFDTVIGITLKVICKWIGSYLFFLGERLDERNS